MVRSMTMEEEARIKAATLSKAQLQAEIDRLLDLALAGNLIAGEEARCLASRMLRREYAQI